MRVVHVATYVSNDGAFGGPIAVAAAQLTELARQGHEVEFVAGWDGKAELALEGVKVSLFKVRRILPLGFSGLWAHGLLRHLRSLAGPETVFHIHAGRDLISMSAALQARRSGVGYVLQTHGMIMPDHRLTARLLDLFVTRRVLQGANRVFALTATEEQGVRDAGSRAVTTQRIANGMAIGPLEKLSERSDMEVLFLARLHPRKRVLAFAGMAQILIARGIVAKFAVVGPDEGDLAELLAFTIENGLEDVLTYEGSIPMADARARLAAASVYVLPSTGEVFPMTILESLSVGTPVVTTTDSGIAQQLSERNAALVTNGQAEELAAAVGRILGDRALRDELSRNGRRALAEVFSITAVAQSLVAAYIEVGTRKNQAR